jgi:hypothetical protein
MLDTQPLLQILQRALDRGEAIDIPGYGSFRTGERGYEFMPDARANIFIAYVEEDLAHARRLRDALADAGFAPWLDKDHLLAGQNWPRAIERAIDLSDAFIACLSTRSLAKRGTFQSELRYALDCANRMPLEESFLLPVRFDNCNVPPTIAKQVQYVDLFPDFDRGFRQLQRALKKRKPKLCGPIALTQE